MAGTVDTSSRTRQAAADNEALSAQGQEPGESVVQPRMAYVIGRLDRALRRRLVEALRPQGLTVAQYTTLSVLRARRGLSNAQLARRALITPQAMNEVIAWLEQEGLVRRRADPNHGRILRAELTPAGRARLAACDAAVEEIEERMLAELSPSERKRLYDDLASCVRMLGGGLAAHRDDGAGSRA